MFCHRVVKSFLLGDKEISIIRRLSGKLILAKDILINRRISV